MSEAREGAHPRRQERNLGGIGYTGERAPLPAARKKASVKGPAMTGAGLFNDSQIVVQTPELPKFYGPEKPHLERVFKKGTKIYSLDFPIPRTSLEGKNRLSGVLEESMPLSIDMGNLVWSEKLKKWTERVKKEHKSALFGGFVIVEAPLINRRGETMVVKGFASLKDLQKEEDNPLARFKKATS